MMPVELTLFVCLIAFLFGIFLMLDARLIRKNKRWIKGRRRANLAAGIAHVIEIDRIGTHRYGMDPSFGDLLDRIRARNRS